MLGNYFMASGVHFDVDAFLKKSSFQRRIVFYRGQSDRHGIIKSDNSGFSVTISTQFGHLEKQIPAALGFLKKHRKELKRLARFSGVTDQRIVFTFCPGNRMCYENFSSELLFLASSLQIGFAISFYPGNASHQVPRRIKTQQSLSKKKLFP